MYSNDHCQTMADWVAHNHIALIDNAFLPESALLLIKHATLFQSDLTPFWGYEIPLHKFPVKPDFLFCVDNPFKLFEQLCDSAVSGKNSLRASHIIYQQYFELVGYWLKNQEKINNVWFEYDNENLYHNHKPNFFYGPANIPVDLQIEMAVEIFSLMGDDLSNLAPFEMLKKCYNNLPAKASITQIGRMLARNDSHLRLFVQLANSNQIIPLLDSLGYNSFLDKRLEQLIIDCNRFATKVELDIDLGETIGEKIGLEIYFDQVEKAILFLNYLYNSQMCAAHLYEYLTEHIQSISLNHSEIYLHFFSHFKIVFTPDKPHYAKAYIAFVDQMNAKHIIKLNHPKVQLL